MPNEADQFLLGGGGGRSAKFENIGDTITGVIVSTQVQQQTDITTGVPLTWDNGDPRLQLQVRLQTSLRDPDIDDDDGIRAVYVKGPKRVGTQSMHDAVATAVRTAGGKGLEEGGTLTVTWVGEEPPTARGLSPRRLWSATYQQPDRAAQSGGFLGTTTPQAPAAVSAAPGMTAEQQASFAAWQSSQKV
jgi:hypothetical protein